MKTILNPSYGLFNCHGIKENVKDTWRYLKRVVYLLRHGYSPIANWDFQAYFCALAKEILGRADEWIGYPLMHPDLSEEENKARWESDCARMVNLLEEMENDDWGGGWAAKEWYERREVIKEEFFKLFSFYFYSLWE